MAAHLAQHSTYSGEAIWLGQQGKPEGGGAGGLGVKAGGCGVGAGVGNLSNTSL